MRYGSTSLAPDPENLIHCPHSSISPFPPLHAASTTRAQPVLVVEKLTKYSQVIFYVADLVEGMVIDRKGLSNRVEVEGMPIVLN